MRDLAPEERLGRLMASRTVYATAVSLVAGLAAAVLLDRAAQGVSRETVFAGLYAFGATAGLISAWMVSRIPEPLMPPSIDRVRLTTLLAAPLRDANFRRLIAFLCSWQFAVNLATPFFTVFMVRQLGYPMTFVMALSIASQLANVAALQSWGVLSDRFANKSVLGVAGPVYILCIAGMVGASQFGDRTLGAAYLVALHVLMGAAVAGVTLSSANIALKLSPKGSATAYIAANALLTSLAAGIAPILGGLFADFFASRRLEILLRWTAPDGALTLRPVTISNWDFYFLAAAVIGLYAVHRLSLVREQGEIERRAMVAEVLQQGRRAVRNVSSVAGLRTMTNIPGSLLRDLRLQGRLARARRNAGARG
jgi:MFS family permease